MTASASVILGSFDAWSATVSWDGGAGTSVWQDAANWSNDVLPGAVDDVIINAVGDLTVTSQAGVTIRSLQSSNSLTLTAGTFRVTGGASVVQGQFTAIGNPLLSVSGAGTTLVLAGPVNLDAASFEATSGATLTLLTLNEYSKPAGCAAVTWQATGADSVLEIPELANVTGAQCSALTWKAVNGGRVSLAKLTTVNEGLLAVLADGTGSVVEMPLLAESLATQRALDLDARNGGTIDIPSFRGGTMVEVTLLNGGVLPVGQMEILRGFSVTGMTVDFPALTNLTAGNVLVNGGAVVSATNLVSHDLTGCPVSDWTVTGSSSALNLPNFATLSGPDCGWQTMRASAGGSLTMTNLSAITDGVVYFIADGAGSTIDLNGLTSSSTATHLVSFEVRNEGAILMPEFPGGPAVTVTLKSAGQMPVTQLKQLSGFTVDGMAVAFPALTNLTGGGVLVSGGAVVSVPNVLEHSTSGACYTYNWRVTGPGSVLSFSILAMLSGPACGWLNVEAIDGGQLTFGALNSVIEGTLYFLADGTNSRLDLAALDQSLAMAKPVSFTARNNGTIAVPLLEGGPTVSIAIQSGGSLDAAQMNLLKGLSVSGTSLALPGITNLFAGDIAVDEGAVLSFPNLYSHDQGAGCAVNSWLVNGAGSVLDLSSLTNLVGGGCGVLEISAFAGGTVRMPSLPVIADGALSFLAEGAGSRIELDMLGESVAALRAVTFEALNFGTINMPLMTGGPTVGVNVGPDGDLSVAELKQLSSIIANGSTVSFPALTEFDAGSISVTNGAVVTVASLSTYARGGSCNAKAWLVRDAGSVLDLPALTYLTGGTCARLDVQAMNGGQLLLSNLSGIPSGGVKVLADGAGSLVDLSSLDSFLNPLSKSQLVATNAGRILLNVDPFILAGVALEIAEGTPSLPEVAMAAENTILHGVPWQSYWVERRDTSFPTNPWVTFDHVALTNEFQVIAPVPGAGTEFRVAEFVADPSAMELTIVPEMGVLPVLFGSIGAELEVQTATGLASPIDWQTRYSIAMTNTFRILPIESFSTPRRFFRIVPSPAQVR
ncbi:hypothetical protein GC207_05060 [bacterium]|nr:hypothetical protein [bacterium]